MQLHLLQLALVKILSRVLLAEGASLPRVDLGYQVHEALSYNESTGLYSFTNIRYAQAPVGNLRWSRPVPPTGRNETVERGIGNRICPQGIPGWGHASSLFGRDFLAGNWTEFNNTQAVLEEGPLLEATAKFSLSLPGASEDCLFLDVIVPRAIFDRKNSTSKGAPVLAWLHGGGYVMGYKNDPVNAPNPAGLIKAAQKDGSDGFIYVGINYRLGSLGWLAGPSVIEANGTANAGLHDQRLALEWIQDNIHLFGGDKEQVTLGGLSAGGGSTIHHITAYGGLKPAPFTRAFSNSGGYQPINSHYQTEQTTQALLRRLNVTSISRARALPSSAVILANMAQVRNSTVGFGFGPTVDGSYVPGLPSVLLAQGSFNPNVSVLLSHTTYEGGEYGAPWVHTDDDFRRYIRSVVPAIQQEPLDHIVTRLYLEQGSVRTLKFAGDFVFSCNTDWVARALGGKAWTYEFGVQRPFHGWDGSYIWNGLGVPVFGAPVVKEVADVMQGYITNFIKKGDPNGGELPHFPQRGRDAQRVLFTEKGVTVGRADGTANEICDWFQKGLFV